MEIKYRNYNNVLYVMLDGELDEHSAKFTSKRLDEIFMSTISKQIIIDLSELTFMVAPFTVIERPEETVDCSRSLDCIGLFLSIGGFNSTKAGCCTVANASCLIRFCQ